MSHSACESKRAMASHECMKASGKCIKAKENCHGKQGFIASSVECCPADGLLTYLQRVLAQLSAQVQQLMVG